MENAPIPASCLCGYVRWEASGPFEFMSHCHCSRCRKAHGAAYATYVSSKAENFRITSGADAIVRYESTPGMFRPFCGHCGSVVPDGTLWNGLVGMPAGPFDADPGARPIAHIFVASKAPWYEITDALLRADAFPLGFDLPVFPDRAPLDPPQGRARGSCLCGGVTYILEGDPIRSRICHCSRCRKAGSAANVAYLVTALGGVRFTRGEELCVTYKVPEARYFKHSFCKTCGSSVPRSDSERGIVVVPMGTLDDDPGVRPSSHIFAGSKAPWDEITDKLPQFDELPPP